MNIATLQDKRASLRKELQFYEDLKPGCGNCKNYTPNECSVFGEMPPGDWFKGPVECESWDYDALPF